MNNRLTTVSYNKEARIASYEQLTALIGDRFQISSYCCDDFVQNKQPEDKLVLITTLPIKDWVVSHLDKDCKYFVAKRTINPRSLHPLFNIPDGSDVLVVNNFYESTLEVITELQMIGVNHLNFYPHDPSKPLEKSFQYAITPDEIHLVPQSIPNVINLGSRLISLLTIAQILFYTTGEQLDDNFLYTRYIRDLVSLSLENTRQIRQNNILQEQMKMVISNFEDGIIVTETNQKIIFHNSMAAEILDQAQLLGKSLDEVFSHQTDGEPADATFVNIADKVIHVTRKEVTLDNGKTIQMLTLKDLTNITKIDEQYKRHKKYAEHTAKYSFHDIVHNSSAISNAINIAKQLAQSESTVVITGESGTGKELFAQSIHNASARKESPFVAINCAALSESLLESELFGYEEGAFTGARKGGKQGFFELADTGTIFLDEIGDAPPAIQNKLLRVLQEKEIMRVSGSKVIPVNVRVITATNKDLFQLVERGLFRLDLYYRLRVLSLHVPPLRERKEDIEILLYYFIHKHSIQKHGVAAKSPAIKNLIEPLCAYSWPGNIRELENIAEYIATIHGTSKDLKEDVMNLISHSPSRNQVQTANNDSLEKLLFRNPQTKAELMCILQILHEAKSEQMLLGRYRLQTLLETQNLALSPQQIKTRLDMLRKAGLISTHNGKGSVLTAEGERYLADR